MKEKLFIMAPLPGQKIYSLLYRGEPVFVSDDKNIVLKQYQKVLSGNPDWEVRVKINAVNYRVNEELKMEKLAVKGKVIHDFDLPR